jgi:hypothetical protein
MRRHCSGVIADGALEHANFREATTQLRSAWQMSVGSDRSLPEVRGKRPLSMRLTNSYMERVIATAATDPVAAHRFIRVVGMVDFPLHLLFPSMPMPVVPGRRRAHTRTTA